MNPPIARAFVLGAGLGTRLRPLTSARPKPLVPVFGKPLITFAFDHLMASGVSDFVVNTHHCPEAYPNLLGGDERETVYRGCPVRFRDEPVLLETGGGIKNVEDLLGDGPFIVYNGDVLADFPLEPAINAHLAKGNLATLVLRSSGGPKHIQCDIGTGRVTDIRGQLGAGAHPSFLFTGISILSPELFRHIPAGQIVSIIPIYLDLIGRGEKIGGVVADGGLWFDLGTRDSYLDAHRLLAPGGYRLSHAQSGWPQPIASDVRIDPTVRIQGCCAIGSKVMVGAGVALTDSVIWEGAAIAPGTCLDRCVVRDGQKVSGTRAHSDF